MNPFGFFEERKLFEVFGIVDVTISANIYGFELIYGKIIKQPLVPTIIHYGTNEGKIQLNNRIGDAKILFLLFRRRFPFISGNRN